MTITIPPDLEQAVLEAARTRCMSVETYVCEAVKGLMRLDDALRDELDAWQEVRDGDFGWLRTRSNRACARMEVHQTSFRMT